MITSIEFRYRYNEQFMLFEVEAIAKSDSTPWTYGARGVIDKEEAWNSQKLLDFIFYEIKRVSGQEFVDDLNISNIFEKNAAMQIFAQKMFVQSDFNFEEYANMLPDAQKIICLDCPGKNSIPSSLCDSTATGSKLMHYVIHLNDYHKWSRDQIADWLDKLHDDGVIDIAFKET